MIFAFQIGLFLARLAVVVHLCSLGQPVSYALALLGAIALLTTVLAWRAGVPCLTWRGSLVGVSYLAMGLMQSTGLSGSLLLLFWLFFALQLLCKFRLAHRSTVTAPVFVSLVDRFPFSVVRHPMTLAEWSMAACVMLGDLTLWNLCAFALISALDFLAIRYEERFLSGWAPYRDYMCRTPFRAFPGLW